MRNKQIYFMFYKLQYIHIFSFFFTSDYPVLNIPKPSKQVLVPLDKGKYLKFSLGIKETQISPMAMV